MSYCAIQILTRLKVNTRGVTFINLLRTKSIQGELFSRLSRLNGSTFVSCWPGKLTRRRTVSRLRSNSITRRSISSHSPRVEFFNPASQPRPAGFDGTISSSSRGAIKAGEWEINRANVYGHKWIRSQMSGLTLAAPTNAIARLAVSYPRRTGPLFRNTRAGASIGKAQLITIVC